MSIEELATMLGEQIMAARAEAWDEGYDIGESEAMRCQMAGQDVLYPRSNPYRKVSA